MKLFRLLLTIIHLGIVFLLLATTLNSYISPQTFQFLNLLSLSFPVLMILNILFCAFWIILRKKRVFFILFLLLFLITPARRWLNYTSKSSDVPDIKIVTFNIKAAQMGRSKIYTYLENSGADIILVQEYGGEFKIPGYTFRTNEQGVVAINAKVEIIKSEKITTDGRGSAIYTDVKVKGKIVRIFNIYLNPFSFDKQKLKPSSDLAKNENKVKYAVKRLVPNFKIHQKEIVAIRLAIESSPHPVIVAGDFNSVPNSYEYYELGRGLTDAFVAAGRGSSTSFHDYKFPLRIDFVFSSKKLKALSYEVDRSVQLSDHFPVITTFKLE